MKKLFLLLTSCLLIQADLLAAEKPNVLIILTDDQGWGDISAFGNKNIRTPELDKLASESVIMDRFFVSPVCAPTRAALLCGKHPLSLGVRGTSQGAERMNLSATTIANVFQKASYRTGLFGKWHNGAHYPYHPNGRGFEEFFGFCNGHWANYFDTHLEHNGKTVATTGFIADVLTDTCLKYISKADPKPFFAILSYNTPHSPFQAPKSFIEKLKSRPITMQASDRKKENITETRAALAMVENIDWNVGRVIKNLEAQGLRESTILIFLSDNGPNTHRWNGDMKGKKGQIDEGSIRVPCFISWPKTLKPHRIEKITAHYDLFPTLSALAGISLEQNLKLDGLDLSPLLKQEKVLWPERSILTALNKRKMSLRNTQFRVGKSDLYDMLQDPEQKNNLLTEQSAVFKKLHSEMLSKFKAQILHPELDSSIPLGYRQFPTTWLLAQDASVQTRQAPAKLKLNCRWPNNAWFIDWQKTSDFLTWDIDVQETAKYQVTIEYTCPAGAVGNTFELRTEQGKINFSIDKVHDPEFISSPDISPRMEAYDKKFTHKTIGTLFLKKGKQSLSLYTQKMIAKKNIDFKSLQIKLLEP